VTDRPLPGYRMLVGSPLTSYKGFPVVQLLSETFQSSTLQYLLVSIMEPNYEVQLSFNTADLLPQLPPLEYEPLTDEEEGAPVLSPPPPPPNTRHPSVVAGLVLLAAPADQFSFRCIDNLLPEMLASLSDSNVVRILGYNEALAAEARTCETLGQLGFLANFQLINAEALVKENRKLVRKYCRKVGAPKSVMQNNVYAVYRRVAIWRDALQDVVELVEDPSAHWKLRRAYWHKLEAANQQSWYCCNLLATL
jgi:hypothetical protein